MNTRLLGRTGLRVTELGLGTYQLTGEFSVPFEEAESILDLALNHGLNYVDTAQMYGFGESEALLGRALRRHNSKTVFVSDKLGYLDRGVCRSRGVEGYQEPEALKRAVKHSFWLLGREHVEVFMIHEPDFDWWQLDYQTGDSVATTVLEDLKREGLIGAIGLGGWNGEKMAALCDTGRFDMVLHAGGIHLLDRPAFDALIPAARRQGMGVIIGGALGQGQVPGLLSKDRESARKLLDMESTHRRGEKLLRLYDLSDETGISIIELAMRYILSFDEVSCHIPGARLAEHLHQNIVYSEKGPLPRDIFEQVIA